ncbi:cornifelin homolog B-like isoform X2 [Denticeps clupeoides]|uniref:Uncharacterized protein n=1 Tax=Denticeps clupeoides TaxID=299321 RepID=A0AAY3ZY66_9TELE|nr:cornifelin homolog B-like isoform X2 [Denticeps clupeoides]
MTSKFVIQQQPVDLLQSRESDEWGSEICDCCEDKAECCFAFCCLPCFACKISREYGQCLCLPLLDLFWIIPPVTYGFRVSMRERYGIRDTMCRDCLLATCCRACSWCQMSKELKRRTIPIALIGAKPTA